ncbi:hypothetical protein FGIG_10760 [Fasciola gigantica]|uniref:Peptidase M14 domain-containing protein n=1 Tax=Fasciola gigantica TaxID=46835 RepID=A0A504YG54_FASGI|nr:hypothetical protein FGIG_10760 [Fasciola gigantica]
MVPEGRVNFPDHFVESLLKKPEKVFKTKQIYYALSNHGSLDAKLSQPRPINTKGVEVKQVKSLLLQKIQWPTNMQVIPERIKHKRFSAKPKEALYRSNGKEKRPQAVGLSQGGCLVYNYDPDVGKYLDGTRVCGSITKTTESEIPTGDCLQFESRFESGNLQKAIRTGSNEYELYLRPDLYTSKYTQWFYFRVSNTIRCRHYRFTVVNFYKDKSLFSQGMRPLMYSETETKLTKTGWRRVGSNIQYYQTQWNVQPNLNHVIRDSQTHSSSCSTSNMHAQNTTCTTLQPGPEQSRTWYSLTWTFELPHDNDVVYFASCYPYTYSQLQDYLTAIRMNTYQKNICEQTQLCTTLAGNPVPLLTITEPERRVKSAVAKKFAEPLEQSDEDPVEGDATDPIRKQCVVITARVHPGETQSSWMVQGLLDFLLSSHPDAELLRANFVFKIVPMLNPDGVIVGNYRCSLSGCDLNRKYTSNLKRFFPTVWHTRKMVLKMMCNYPVLVYCDLHGHSRKQQMFIYGCRSVDPSARLYDRVFPWMLSRNAPELVSFNCENPRACGILPLS